MWLTANLQHCRWHQVATPVSDFVYPAVAAGQTHYDDFLVGTVPSERHEAPVAQVSVCDLAIMDQLHRTIMGPGVRLLKVFCRDECKVAVRNGKGQVYRLLDETTEAERACWLPGKEKSERVSDGERKIKRSVRCDWIQGSADQLSIILCLTEDGESAVRQHVPVGVPHGVVALVRLRDSLSHPDLAALLQPSPAGSTGLRVGAVPKHHWHGLCWSPTRKKLQQGSTFRKVLFQVFPVVPLMWYYAICSSTRQTNQCKVHIIWSQSRLKYLKLSTGASHTWIQMRVWYYTVPHRSPSPLSGLTSCLWSVQTVGLWPAATKSRGFRFSNAVQEMNKWAKKQDKQVENFTHWGVFQQNTLRFARVRCKHHCSGRGIHRQTKLLSSAHFFSLTCPSENVGTQAFR